MFIENIKYSSPHSNYLLPKDLDRIKINKEKTVIVSMAFDQNIMNELLKRFPEGEIEEREGFGMFKINF